VSPSAPSPTLFLLKFHETFLPTNRAPLPYESPPSFDWSCGCGTRSRRRRLVSELFLPSPPISRTPIRPPPSSLFFFERDQVFFFPSRIGVLFAFDLPCPGECPGARGRIFFPYHSRPFPFFGEDVIAWMANTGEPSFSLRTFPFSSAFLLFYDEEVLHFPAILRPPPRSPSLSFRRSGVQTSFWVVPLLAFSLIAPPQLSHQTKARL